MGIKLICVARCVDLLRGRPLVLPEANTPSPAFGVMSILPSSNEPDAISPVGSIDGDSWNNKRLDFVPRIFQVSAHLLEYHASAPSNKAANVLSDDPRWLELSYNASHFRPEVAVIFRAAPSSRRTEGLAREASGEEKRSALGVGSKFANVPEDRSIGPVLVEDLLREGIAVAEDVPDPPLRPDPIRGEREPADAREEVEVDDWVMPLHAELAPPSLCAPSDP